MKEYKTKMMGERRTVNFHSKLVAKDQRLKNLEHVKKFDKEMFEKGLKWFDSGLSLDDADLSLRENFNFINGFEKGKRLKNINDNIKVLGNEWFDSGLPLENAPSNYINNPHFIEGYNEAKKKNDKGNSK